jgi:hypothetical protein
MPLPGAEQHNTQASLRAFYQPGGPGPEQSLYYGGADMGYIKIEGVSIPVSGDVSPMFVHDPRRIGAYTNVATMTAAPDLANATITFSEKRGGVPAILSQSGCTSNFYEVVGDCKDPGNFLSGWSQYCLIYPRGKITSIDLGDRTSYDGTNVLQASCDVTFAERPYSVGQLNFGVAALGVLTGVIVRDICYGSALQCGGACGAANDGTRYIYACVDGAAAAKPYVMYSNDYGATFTQLSIVAGANAEIVAAIAVAGDKLIVVSKTAGSATQGGYYVADLDPDTGVPSTFTKVTTGFIALASKAPNDLYVAGPNEIYFAADGGLIYKSTDPYQGVVVSHNSTATVANLTRISGIAGGAIVAVGATSAIIKTNNQGRTWSATTTSPVGGGLTAIAVLSDKLFWTGGDTGKIFYTQNGGVTWTEKTFNGSGAGGVKDIIFATAEVGYFSHSTATPTARIFTTWSGGFNWTNTAPRLNSLANFTNAYRLAVPETALANVAANNLLVAGSAATATDGVGYIASSPTVL